MRFATGGLSTSRRLDNFLVLVTQYLVKLIYHPRASGHCFLKLHFVPNPELDLYRMQSLALAKIYHEPSWDLTIVGTKYVLVPYYKK